MMPLKQTCLWYVSVRKVQTSIQFKVQEPISFFIFDRKASDRHRNLELEKVEQMSFVVYKSKKFNGIKTLLLFFL